MILENIFSLQDPECIFCKKSLKFINSKGVNIQMITYQCLNCEEIFQVESLNNNYFMFTISNLEAHLLLKSEKFCVLKKNEAFKNINWIPMFNFNFSNKDTLYNKLKIYLTFS